MISLRQNFTSETATIANGATDSDAINITGKTLVGIITPAVMTSTSFSFSVSIDGITYAPFYNSDGTLLETTHTTAAAWHIGISSIDFESVNFIKLVAGAAEGAERTITLALRTL